MRIYNWFLIWLCLIGGFVLKKCICLALNLCIIISLLFAWEGVVFAEEKEPDVLEISAKAYVLIDADSGKIILENNMNEQLSMASTTKIMTTLLALEYHDIDKEFVVDPTAILTEGSSMGLRKDDIVTLRALCYGMMLESGNDAANAVAYALAGGIDGFAEMMNSKAKELGMNNTSFQTPSGLDGDRHYSTAYDMAILAKAALENKEFGGICSTQRAQVSFGNPPSDRWMKNHNRLLKEYEGCIGVKTGFTKKSGRCLVSAAQRNGITLICVTLNAPNDWQDHASLFDYGFENYSVINIDPNLKSIQLPVTGSTQKYANLYTDLSAQEMVVANDDLDKITKSINLPHFLFSPVKADQRVGEINYYLNGDLLCSFPVYVENEISRIPKKTLLNIFKR